MAKKATVNKSQLIREALAAHPEKSNIEISELLKLQGLKVKPMYVSTIKGNLKRKRRGKKGKKMLARRSMVRAGTVEVGNGVHAAVEFIKSAGGLAQAKAAMATIEEIGKML